MESRKIEEISFHNTVRQELLKNLSDKAKMENPNTKFYQVARYGRRFEKKYTKKQIQGKKVLDFCCGTGWQSIELALDGAERVVGIDISDVSIEVARKKAKEAGVMDKCEFMIMDAENMVFEEDTFDVVWGGAYSTISTCKRLMKASPGF